MNRKAQVATVGNMRNAYKFVFGKHEREIDAYMKMYFKEAECEGVEWTQLARDRKQWRLL
jgi:hypothetical protein